MITGLAIITAIKPVVGLPFLAAGLLTSQSKTKDGLIACLVMAVWSLCNCAVHSNWATEWFAVRHYYPFINVPIAYSSVSLVLLGWLYLRGVSKFKVFVAALSVMMFAVTGLPQGYALVMLAPLMASPFIALCSMTATLTAAVITPATDMSTTSGVMLLGSIMAMQEHRLDRLFTGHWLILLVSLVAVSGVTNAVDTEIMVRCSNLGKDLYDPSAWRPGDICAYHPLVYTPYKFLGDHATVASGIGAIVSLFALWRYCGPAVLFSVPVWVVAKTHNPSLFLVAFAVLLIRSKLK